MKDSQKQRAIKVWYSYAYDSTLNEHCHIFTTDKDCLSCEALYITSFTTEYPGKMVQYIEQYATQHQDSVVLYLFGRDREWYHGKLEYDSNLHPMPIDRAVLLEELPDSL